MKRESGWTLDGRSSRRELPMNRTPQSNGSEPDATPGQRYYAHGSLSPFLSLPTVLGWITQILDSQWRERKGSRGCFGRPLTANGTNLVRNNLPPDWTERVQTLVIVSTTSLHHLMGKWSSSGMERRGFTRERLGRKVGTRDEPP